MIAEYERAQIAERTRRGKRHRAKAGCVNVLSGAPYGYRYIKKSEHSEACYAVFESEAEVGQKRVCLVHDRGLEHRGHRAPFKWPADCDSIWQATVGAIDGLGDAEKSRLSRQGLLWQNRDVCTAESHQSVAAKGRF